MPPRMSNESARHILAEQKHYGITSQGIIALFTNRAYDALGHVTWDQLVAAELRDHIDKLDDDARLELAKAMRDAGCSLRATAATVGWSHTTVRNRTENLGEKAKKTIGADGVAYRTPRNRKTFPATVLDAGWELRNAAEKLNTLLSDDRFRDCRPDVAPQIISHLKVAETVADHHIQQLGKKQTSKS